jgi:hypothetical protein
VLLEPWLVLACLAGAVAVFDSDRLATSTRRLAWGGTALGFAGAVKVWAIVPVAVIAVLCLPGTRRLLAFIGGVAAGFLIPVVPFAVASPARFWNSVIVAQLVRTDVRIPFGYRVQQMAGLAVGHPAAAVLAVAGVLFVLLVFGSFAAAWRVTGRAPPPLDVFAAASTLLVIGIFLIPDDFYYHYAGFLAPFAGLTLACPRPGCWPPGPVTAGRAARPGPVRAAGDSVTGLVPGNSRTPVCCAQGRKCAYACVPAIHAGGGHTVGRLRGDRPGVAAHRDQPVRSACPAAR